MGALSRIITGQWLSLGTAPGLLNAIIFTGLTGMSVLCYTLAIIKDPGQVPSSYEVDLEDSDTSMHEVKRKGGDLRYCQKCGHYKPPHAHHCRVCKRCVLRMDHHCWRWWIGAPSWHSQPAVVPGEGQAASIMRSIAAKNGKSLLTGVSLALAGDEQDAADSDESSGSLVDVFWLPVTRTRMVLMAFIWLAYGVGYYGLSLNVVNLSTSLYLSVFLNGIAEIPAFALTAVMLDKFGG